MVRNVIAVQAVTSCHPKKGGGSYSATALSSKCNFEIGLVMVPLAVRKRAERTISSDPEVSYQTLLMLPSLTQCQSRLRRLSNHSFVIWKFFKLPSDEEMKWPSISVSTVAISDSVSRDRPNTFLNGSLTERTRRSQYPPVHGARSHRRFPTPRYETPQSEQEMFNGHILHEL
ncbi:hypothetical protein M514_20414 [Trichuris suis]|uniref:Uncharacterized protein n=1 Tax=Trichuris suis TaxID=68888 RepID=A0A085ND32_9BILA|nr:hypothetical protein M514_20414 [Trichuris suis]